MKTLLLKKRDPSFWVSCQSITRNLILSYQHLLKDDVSIWNYDQDQCSYEVMELAKKIKDSGFQQIVWVDHHPHPQKLLNALDKQFLNDGEKPQLNFHLFGDFSLFAQEWRESSPFLEKFEVRLICASSNQARFVQRFLQNDENVFVFPFPVDESSFYFSSKERNKWREQFNVGPNSKVVLYTGRLSLQKNVVELIRVFSRVKNLMGDADIRLFIAGPMDDLGLPFLGKRGLPGSYFRIWHKEWMQQKELVENKQLVYLGEQNSKQLKSAYCGADLFCSLSTHNDEDYGMSAAEASCAGLPLLLTQWGGFPDFVNQQKKNDARFGLIPVDIDSGVRPTPLWDTAQKKMFSQLNQPSVEINTREGLAKEAQKKFGIFELSGKLNEIYKIVPSTFKGFNESFSKFSSSFAVRPEAPFANIKGKYNDLYKESYRPYLNPGDVQ